MGVSKKDQIRYASVVPLIGGMTIGNKLAFGNDPEFFASYEAFADNEKLLHNYMPDVPRFDIEKDQFDDYFGELDVVSAVCPCAGLSMMNASASRGADAPQNQWMFKTADFVLEKLQPRVFFGENAPGLYTNLGREVADKLYEKAKKNGYSFSLIRTNTQLHGIPQRRVRTFYFFWNSRTAPVMNYYDTPSKHWLEYLKEIPQDATHQDGVADKSKEISYVYLREKLPAEKLFINRSTVEIILNEGLYEDYVKYLTKRGYDEEAEKITYIKEKLDMGKGFWNSFPHLLDKDTPVSGPVTGRSMDRLIHPVEQRTFTYREYMHLMGMPHDFQLLDPKKDLNKVAQNVPTCTARDWSLEIKKFLKGELSLSDTDYLRQDNIAKKIDQPKVLAKATPVF
jgi:site-specific DNA-cytosine methylase